MTQPAPQVVGAVASDCPLKKGPLSVHVVRDGTGADEAGFIVTATGASELPPLTTGGNGVADFGSVTNGPYQISATAPDGFTSCWALPAGKTVDVQHAQGIHEIVTATPIVNVVTPHVDASSTNVYFLPTAPPDKPLPELQDEPPAPPSVEVYLTESKPENAYPDGGKPSIVGGGLQTYVDDKLTTAYDLDTVVRRDAGGAKTKFYLKGLAEGKKNVTFTLDPAKNEFFTVEGPVEKEFDVAELVVVQPFLDLEYKVVQLNRDLAKHQDGGDTKYPVEATYVLASVKASKDAPEFTKGAMLKADPDDYVVAYEEADLTTKIDLTKPLDKDKLFSKDAFKIYLAGAKKGKFTLTLDVEDPQDVRFVRAKAALAKMAVVELEMKLHQHSLDKLDLVEIDRDVPYADYQTAMNNLVLPEQVLLEDEKKVKNGRFLHAQADGHFGRAKLLVKKLVADEWPDGTGDYKLVFNASKKADQTKASAAIKLYDAETKGDEKPLPYSLKVSDMQGADTTLWVEGVSASEAARDVRLDIGIDRDAVDGEQAKATPKRNADWAFFTVAKIDWVKLDYKAEVGKAAAWDETTEKFYINLKDNPDGRKVEIGAKLTTKIADIPVYFMLAEHENNRKTANWGVDMPAAWDHHKLDEDIRHSDKDKTKRKALLHLTAKTDADGYAKAELLLSRIGGDVYIPGAYIEQDPQLAKYIPGHADLQKRKPVLADKQLKVWRHLWYQITQAAGVNAPQAGVAETGYKEVKAVLEYSQTVEVKKADCPASTYFKKHMFEQNGGDDYVVNVSDDSNIAFFRGKRDLTKLDTQPKLVNFTMTQCQYDDGAGSGLLKETLKNGETAGDVITLTAAETVTSPSIPGGDFVINAYYKYNGVQTAIPHANVKVKSTRADTEDVDVELPVGTPVATKKKPIRVYVEVATADGPYLGQSNGDQIMIVWDPNDVADYNDSVMHELGHSLNQTPNPGASPGHPHIPDHPNQADAGQGNHCQEKTGADYICIMYDSGPLAAGLHKWCPVCHPYLLAERMDRFT